MLRVPENGYDLDDQDVGCSWEELVVKQHRGDFGEITKEDLEVGDTLAMLDRNCITEEFVRRVFVLAATEEDVIVFDEGQSRRARDAGQDGAQAGTCGRG